LVLDEPTAALDNECEEFELLTAPLDARSNRSVPRNIATYANK
jgi:ABC-type bacteriocin/lantibiotic exporter with double-glycine peptidase domain